MVLGKVEEVVLDHGSSIVRSVGSLNKVTKLAIFISIEWIGSDLAQRTEKDDGSASTGSSRHLPSARCLTLLYQNLALDALEPSSGSETRSKSLSAAFPRAMAAALPTPAYSVSSTSSHLDIMMSDDSAFKRKRPLDDIGDRDHKKVHREGNALGIEDLHLDVGEKYLLLQNSSGGQTHQTSQLPRLSEDLFEIFGLVGLAAEVAREKPNGEKNALRKTYKGHIKRLGVAGHFDVQKKKEGDPSEFMAMFQVPELEWNVHQVKGRDISDGLSEATLSSLGRSMTMAKGPVPKSVWDTSVLGDLLPTIGNASKPTSGKPSTSNTPLISTPNPMIRSKSQLPPGHDPNRPRRNIKKRTYGDSSYEGYGEGFPDDDVGLDTGYSTAEGEGNLKRRKKNSGNSTPNPLMQRQSYGPGMVGA
ncbi:hypothetical protein E4U43_007294 [Claviceps pusilla]|uniref:Mediator of RNA polymerase II transcription subunit 19 n=1 Tax=Claviceps pusilla TaxID=123648 RepID=A0A9P7NF58_9HYPO|nr:hypothetical protein E4U43_007294 [Claviceps pusilla]